jgi:hypothetical protein
VSLWIDRILSEFPADLARFWIAVDPDNVLLNEPALAVLRERGFEVLPFEDSVAFRAEYEERFRQAWDRGEQAPGKALVLHYRESQTDDLPWDYLRQARIVRLSLANLFSKLSYGVVRQIGTEYLEVLFDAHARHASQSLGETATREFVLTHIFRLSPHLIARPEEFWRELLRLHYREAGLPSILATHVERILHDRSIFAGWPIEAWFSSKSAALRVVQDGWYRYLEGHGITGFRVGDPPADYGTPIEIPFEHPDVRAIVDSMFLDGTLHPLAVQGLPESFPEWAKVGIVEDPAVLRNLVLDGLGKLIETLPGPESSHRDWSQFAQRFGEILARFHNLDTARTEGLRERIQEVQSLSDDRLQAWLAKHYADLPSLPVLKAPVMVHHIPRFLSLRRGAGEAKIALLVFDGMAFDQWIQIREQMARRMPGVAFEENACFAWAPTLTAISRQAVFSGQKPREFADSIETTRQEPALWSRFWQDQGLRNSEVSYRKGIRHADQLDELAAALANPTLKVAGIVVDTVDEIVHGAVLGKRGIASQITHWCESGFVERLFSLLLDQGFHVYVTADHGNVDALGAGRPNQGVIAETRGERVRVYRSEELVSESQATISGSVGVRMAGLPADFFPLFAGQRTAFATPGERLVVHGGLSVEELIVPFVKVTVI